MMYLLVEPVQDFKIISDRRHFIQVDLSQEEGVLTCVTRNFTIDQTR